MTLIKMRCVRGLDGQQSLIRFGNMIAMMEPSSWATGRAEVAIMTRSGKSSANVAVETMKLRKYVMAVKGKPKPRK